MKFVITAAAEADLEAIGDYIARDNPTRAVSFIRELERCCEEIAEMPQTWQLVPRYEAQGIRRRVYGRYLIFYSTSTDQVTILHVLNGAMDYEAILFPGP